MAQHDVENEMQQHDMQSHMERQHDESGRDTPEESVDEKPWLILPEEVVDMIIARMPFPFVFNARRLSRSWNEKISPPWENSPRKALTPFQQEASSVCHKWPSYCPIFVNGEEFRGFDRVSSQWKTLFPRVSSQWKALPPGRKLSMERILPGSYCFSGSLMLFSSSCISTSGTQISTFVTNVITGSSTQLQENRPVVTMLPPRDSNTSGKNRATSCRNRPVFTRLLPGDSNTSYRVIEAHRIWNKRFRRQELQTSLYDSKVGGWSSVTNSAGLPNFVGDVHNPLSSTVYHHGKLYCLCRARFSMEMLLCINNVDSDQTWTATRLTFSHFVNYGAILLCGGKVLVVIHTGSQVVVYKLGLKVLGSLKELGKGPGILPDMYISCIQFASDDDFIYVNPVMTRNVHPVLTYSVHSGEWGTLPLAYDKKPSEEDENLTVMLNSAFRPGLYPFVVVEQSDTRPEFCQACWALPGRRTRRAPRANWGRFYVHNESESHTGLEFCIAPLYTEP